MAKKTKTTMSRRGGRTPGQWVHLSQDAVGKFRKDAKLSRSKLAELLGVSGTSVQNWETGRSVPIKRYQQRLVELMKGRPQGAESGEALAAAADAIPLQLQVARLTVVSEIVKGYLATTQGGKVSQEQLIALTKALRGALA